MKVTIENFKEILTPSDAEFLASRMRIQAHTNNTILKGEDGKLYIALLQWARDCRNNARKFSATHVHLSWGLKVMLLDATRNLRYLGDEEIVRFMNEDGVIKEMTAGTFRSWYFSTESELFKKLRDLLDGITAEELTQVQTLINRKYGELQS